MAQYSMHAYDADIFIPEFKGLRQYGDPVDGDLRYSPDCMNAETIGGVLQPAAELEFVRLKYGNSTRFFGASTTTAGGSRLCTMMSAKVKSLVSIYQQYEINYTIDDGSEYTVYDSISPQAEYWLYIFALDNKLYYMELNNTIPNVIKSVKNMAPTGHTVASITIPVGKFSGTFSRSKWSWCTYEMNFGHPTPVPPGYPVGRTNVIVMSNPVDGAYYCYKGGSLNQITSAPANFRFVARYAERIWGCGTGEDKDVIFYSKPYNCTDWSMDEDIPEDGGGFFRNATFDDDAIVGLVPMGDVLIAFSNQRAWRISGTDPSNFIIQEQYGNGTKYPETIAVMDDVIIMLGENGMVAYDGNIVRPFQQESTWELLRKINQNTTKEQRPVAIKTADRYLLALSNELIPSGRILSDDGYRLITYNRIDGSVNQYEIPEIAGFCAENEYAYALITDKDGHADVAQMIFDSWYTQRPFEKDVHWSTPWITMGRKDVQKGGFDIYIQPEIIPAEDNDQPVVFSVSIQTEKKTKTKIYNAYPVQQPSAKLNKAKRIHISNSGRRFRLILDVTSNNLAWRLIGGIHIIAETDRD